MSVQTDFIAKIAPIIRREAQARGYKVCSAAIAQACLESNYGRSKLSAAYHNYFGLKCGSAWKGKAVTLSTKEEYTVGKLTTIKDAFRAYDSMEEGVKGYYDFVATKRYAALKTAATAREYLERIKAAGYATSSVYVASNMRVVTAYDLESYDAYESGKKPVGGFVVGKVYTLTGNMIIRDAPGGAKIRYEDMTKDARAHGHPAADGTAVLDAGTRVTCKAVTVNDKGQVWIRIPSGWLCAVGGTGVSFVDIR